MTDRAEFQTEDDLPRPAPRRRGRRLVRIAVVLVLLILAGIVALGFRLAAGPLWTQAGTGQLAAALEASIGSAGTASVGVIGLSMAEDLSPRLHLRDVQIDRGDAGGVSVDTLSVDTTWRTLLGLESRLRAVAADHVFVTVRPGADPLPAVPEMLAGLDSAVKATGIGHLDVDSLTLRRLGDGGESTPVLEEVGVTAEAGDGDTLSAKLAGEGVGGSWSLSATIAPGEGETARLMRITTRGLDIADLAMMAGDASPGASGPVSLEGRIGLTAEGAIAEGVGQLVVGPVQLAGRPDAPVVSDRSRLNLVWDGVEGVVRLDPSPVMLPAGHAVIVGEVKPPQGGDPLWHYRFAAHAEGGDVSSERDALGHATGSYDPPKHLFVVDELAASVEGTRFASAMRLSHEDGRINGALSGLFPEMTAGSLKALWPAVLAPAAREWVVENIHGGLVKDASVDLTFSGEASGTGAASRATAGLTFRFEQLAFRSFKGGPMIRDAAGTGRYADDRFEIALESAVADLEDGRTLVIGPSSFVVPVVSKEVSDGEIRLALSGDAAAAMALWQRLPMAAAATFSADPAAVNGQAAADLEIRLPLGYGVGPEDVAYGGRVRLTDFDLPPRHGEPTLADADLEISISDGVAAVSGKATVDGVRADIDLSQPLSGGEPAASAVRMVLDAAARKKLGLELGDAISGPVTVSLASTTDAAGRTARAVTVDLTKASVAIPPVGFVKPKGKAGTVTFTLSTDGGRTRVDDLVVKMGAAQLEGSLVLDGEGRLVSGSFPKLRFSARDSLALKLARTDGGGLKLTVTGDRLDGRELVKRQLKRGEEDGSVLDAPVELDVEIGTVSGFGEEDLTGFNLAARLDGQTVTALSLTAQTEGGGAASATLTPMEGGRRLQVEAGEVGRLLRFLDLYPRVFGGRATVVGTIDRAGVVRAAVDGSRWRIVEEPALARLSTAARDGPTAGYSTADIQRLLFDLTLSAGRLSIDDGVVRAETAGLSLQGDVDFRRNMLSLSGSYLPASAFDSLIGKIPLLGQTVFAGGRAGLLGVSFRLTGPIEEPSLSVNPLSVMAPGIFRKLFELR